MKSTRYVDTVFWSFVAEADTFAVSMGQACPPPSFSAVPLRGGDTRMRWDDVCTLRREPLVHTSVHDLSSSWRFSVGQREGSRQTEYLLDLPVPVRSAFLKEPVHVAHASLCASGV